MMKSLLKRKKLVSLAVACVLLGSALFATILARKGASKGGEPVKGTATKEEQGMVTLSPEKLAAAGIEIVSVARGRAEVPLMATAAIELNSDRTSRISSRVSGRIVRLNVSQGDRVKAGQPLAFMDTVELDQIWSEYRKNTGRFELARRNLGREEALFEKNVAPEKDVLKARQELSEAEADLTLSKERFRLLGIDVQTVEARKNGDAGRRPLIPIVSTVGGVVIEKPVTQGEAVNSEKLLFVVADLSTLWVLVDIYEKDMSKLKAGAVVSVSVNAFPGKVFQGRISYIGDVVDERTRTVKARVTIDNGDGFLKPGMFAAVSIDAEKDAGTVSVIAVPEEAVLIDGVDRYVFLRAPDGRFRKNDVATGRAFGKKIEITGGLREGDKVVVKGTFGLKSEYKQQLLKGE